MKTFETELIIIEAPVYDTIEMQKAEESKVKVKRILDRIFND